MGKVRIFTAGSLAMVMLAVYCMVPLSQAQASSLSITLRATAGMRPTTDYVSTNKAWARTVSDDGRYSVFTSNSKQLIPGDDIIDEDIFIYDRDARKLEIVRGNDGQQPGGISFSATISGNGRYVAFFSYSTKLTPEQADLCKFGCLNLFVYDRQTKQTIVANRSSQGRLIDVYHNNVIFDQPVLSRDGRFIAFRSQHALFPGDNNHSDDIMLRDLKTGVTRPVSVDSAGNFGPDQSAYPSVSQDGRYVTFETTSALVPEDNSRRGYDVYMRDMVLGRTRLVSHTTNGQVANSSSFDPMMSQDGRYIAFASAANNLVPNDTADFTDVFVYEVATDSIKRISTARHNTAQSNEHSYGPDISNDGRFITYVSRATNLVNIDSNELPDIFVYDRDFDVTRRVSLGSRDGVQSNGYSERASISGDGKTVSFMSDATNITGENPETVPPQQIYLNYNPVAFIPYYDPVDFLDF